MKSDVILNSELIFEIQFAQTTIYGMSPELGNE